MKGYYSLGLAGYEVEIDDGGERVSYQYVGPTGSKPVTQHAKVRYTAGGRAYFLANGRRIHLDECLRV